MGGHAAYGVSPWPSLINWNVLPEKRNVTRDVPEQWVDSGGARRSTVTVYARCTRLKEGKKFCWSVTATKTGEGLSAYIYIYIYIYTHTHTHTHIHTHTIFKSRSSNLQSVSHFVEWCTGNAWNMLRFLCQKEGSSQVKRFHCPNYSENLASRRLADDMYV